jgi:hypothetical protein
MTPFVKRCSLAAKTFWLSPTRSMISWTGIGWCSTFVQTRITLFINRFLRIIFRLESSENQEYWAQLHEKCTAIHLEIQEKSRSINKSFGIFNEQTLRLCSTNVAHNILIASRLLFARTNQ